MSTNDWINTETARLRPDLADTDEIVAAWLAKVQRMLVAGTAEEATRLSEEVQHDAVLVATKSYECRKIGGKLAEHAAVAAVRAPTVWSEDPVDVASLRAEVAKQTKAAEHAAVAAVQHLARGEDERAAHVAERTRLTEEIANLKTSLGMAARDLSANTDTIAELRAKLREKKGGTS